MSSGIEVIRDVRDAAEAARWLQHDGVMVEWCPGDATRYDLLVVRDVRQSGVSWLVCINIGKVFTLPATQKGMEWWLDVLPPGWWSGLRPLLSALGIAPGPIEYCQADARAETAARKGMAHSRRSPRTDRGFDASMFGSSPSFLSET